MVSPCPVCGHVDRPEAAATASADWTAASAAAGGRRRADGRDLLGLRADERRRAGAPITSTIAIEPADVPALAGTIVLVHGDGRLEVVPDGAEAHPDPDLVVSAPYCDVMAWLHGGLRLGRLAATGGARFRSVAVVSMITAAVSSDPRDGAVDDPWDPAALVSWVHHDRRSEG